MYLCQISIFFSFGDITNNYWATIYLLLPDVKNYKIEKAWPLPSTNLWFSEINNYKNSLKRKRKILWTLFIWKFIVVFFLNDKIGRSCGGCCGSLLWHPLQHLDIHFSARIFDNWEFIAWPHWGRERPSPSVSAVSQGHLTHCIWAMLAYRNPAALLDLTQV